MYTITRNTLYFLAAFIPVYLLSGLYLMNPELAVPGSPCFGMLIDWSPSVGCTWLAEVLACSAVLCMALISIQEMVRRKSESCNVASVKIRLVIGQYLLLLILALWVVQLTSGIQSILYAIAAMSADEMNAAQKGMMFISMAPARAGAVILLVGTVGYGIMGVSAALQRRTTERHTDCARED